MKKLTFILLLSIACAGTAFGQAGFGIKGGMNFATLENLDASNRTGWHFGIFAGIPLSKNIAIQPEALISTQGANLDVSEISLNYVTVPILLRLTVIRILNVHFGPQFGFLTKAEYRDESVKDIIKNSDIGAAFGAGVNLPFRLEAGARYNLGFTNINDTGIEFNDAKNRNFQIYAAWRFIGSSNY